MKAEESPPQSSSAKRTAYENRAHRAKRSKWILAEVVSTLIYLYCEKISSWTSTPVISAHLAGQYPSGLGPGPGAIEVIPAITNIELNECVHASEDFDEPNTLNRLRARVPRVEIPTKDLNASRQSGGISITLVRVDLFGLDALKKAISSLSKLQSVDLPTGLEIIKSNNSDHVRYSRVASWAVFQMNQVDPGTSPLLQRLRKRKKK
ncbi:hypothetical protein N7495_002797 [Penicillium taxi]|uniref:uncharacterized protein n=1 Tax=Penicillium taxi TaxID=168475 RepID=UPI002545242D|nr:uncharacterized protein N7495_002797 [Penicillium taxi]KAJ5902269.1 hypothetical protein N7495_002797 [Penicillium taxi]